MKKAEQKASSIFTMLMAIVLALGIGFMPNAQYAFADDVGSTGEGTVSTVSFPDVTDETPHKADIEWLAANGITTGFPNGNFEPLQNVARADMAAFLYRLAGSPAYEVTDEDMAAFTDVDENTPHLKEVCWLASTGISTGFPDGSFQPYAQIARCDMAAFLYRVAGSPAYEVTDEDMAAFTDVDENTPHLKEVCWLASTGISTGFPDGSFQPYAQIVRCD
ncbi:MAG: S-layer homology domain-containing protein, partial [Eggerthellaceae bacterium]